MILATDVYYDDVACTARAAAISFATWGDAMPASEHVVTVEVDHHLLPRTRPRKRSRDVALTPPKSGQPAYADGESGDSPWPSCIYFSDA